MRSLTRVQVLFVGMLIRKATAADVPDLRRIYLESRTDSYVWLDTSGYALKDFDRDTRGERVWVAEAAAARLVGFISVWMPENFIHHLYVVPGMYRKGIGRALLRECLETIGRPARLKCMEKNARAHQFYAALGWQAIDHGDGPDGKYVLMECEEHPPAANNLPE